MRVPPHSVNSLTLLISWLNACWVDVHAPSSWTLEHLILKEKVESTYKRSSETKLFDGWSCPSQQHKLQLLYLALEFHELSGTVLSSKDSNFSDLARCTENDRCDIIVPLVLETKG